MKPGDHPEFFRFPAPEGRSRESTIVLDARGRFWHDGAPVEHAAMQAALSGWISRHPDDGRYILTNGYDWTYFTVDDAPYFVRSLRIESERIVLLLSDGAEEGWDPEATRSGPDGALYTTIKRDAPRGPFEAKFTPHAQGLLAPVLVETANGPNPGAAAVRVGDSLRLIGTAGPARVETGSQK